MKLSAYFAGFDSLEVALSDVFQGRISILPRMRLMCKMKTIDGIEKPPESTIGLCHLP